MSTEKKEDEQEEKRNGIWFNYRCLLLEKNITKKTNENTTNAKTLKKSKIYL